MDRDSDPDYSEAPPHTTCHAIPQSDESDNTPQFPFTALRFISASTSSTLRTFTNAATLACNTNRIRSGSLTANSLNVARTSSSPLESLDGRVPGRSRSQKQSAVLEKGSSAQAWRMSVAVSHSDSSTCSFR